MIFELNSKVGGGTNLFLKQLKINFACIKLEKVVELKKLDQNSAIFIKLINIFQIEASKRIPELKTDAQKENYDAIKKTTHRFKSTAYNLGASRAVEIAKQIDFVASKSAVDKRELEQLIVALDQECQEAFKVLRTYVK